MADAKEVAQHHEHVAAAPRSKKRGCVNHCKRFWWAYLIGFVGIAILVVCLIIFVAIPKIGQSKMDKAHLNIESIIISEPQPESYRMAVNSTITTDGGIHADIAPFTGIMYLEDLEPHEAFASIDFPATTSAELTIVNVSQHIDITNMAAFTTFNTWLLSNETLKMTIEGDTSIKVKGISKKFPVTFKKTVDLKGLNGFHGLEVTSANIDPVLRKKNFNGTVDIPNASVLTIDIGNATFFNKLNGKEIGIVYLDNLVLHPGSNNVTMFADIEQLPVLKALTAEPLCVDGVVPFELAGKDVVHNGERLPYFADALSQLDTAVDIALKDAFGRAGMEVGCDDEDEKKKDKEEESKE